MRDTPDWLERVEKTSKFHKEKVKEWRDKHNMKWTIDDTAKKLNRSKGSISEDLMAARWLRTHSHSMLKISAFWDVLAFVRKKKAEMDDL